MNMLLENKKVAIIGGGPGGLTLARLLQVKGIEVKVYERDIDQHVRQQGATLDLHYESGLKALRAAGLMDEFKKNYRPGAERVVIVDNNAVVHYSERNQAPLSDLDCAQARPEIDRCPLRDLLIASLQDNTIVWNSNFIELKESGSGLQLFFKNGTTAFADLVIAADGANTRLRKYMTDIPRIYSGTAIVEGNIYNAAVHAPHLWKLTDGGKVFAHWSGKTIVLSAKGEGSLSFYTISKETEEWVKTSAGKLNNKEAVCSWFKQRFSDWSSDWHEVFLTDASYFVCRPQYYFPSDQQWQSLPNLTMLGDAAHQTPPSGDGVNQAMLDALELYEALCLSNFSNVPEAISSFEKAMLRRTAVATQEALEITQTMLAEDNLQFMLDFFNHKNDL